MQTPPSQFDGDSEDTSEVNSEILDEDLHEHFQLTVDKGQAPLRIDKYLLGRLDISRNRIQGAAKMGMLRINDVAVKSNYKVRPGDNIRILYPQPPHNFELKAENIPLDIRYEDESVLVLHKPAGLVVHPAPGNYTGTLASGLLWHFGKTTAGDLDPQRPGIVHRLDKNTSGLMVIGKTPMAVTHLSAQFFKRTVERSYLALVWGVPSEPEGTIEGNIGRDRRYRQRMGVFPEADFGKRALTNYKLIDDLLYVSLLKCQLQTGRTHQIRVHMAWKGHPLFNDSLYGGDKIVKGTVFTRYRQFVSNSFKIMPRQALHATSLGFDHPVSGERLQFDAPLPEDFSKLLAKWRKYTGAI